MRIRWDPVQVMEAADQVEVQVAKIMKPLEQAKAAAEKGKEIPHLPEYVKYRFNAFLQEIERAVGGVERRDWSKDDGSTYLSKGSLHYRIDEIRKEVPKDALAEAKAQPALFKRAM